VIAKGEIVAQGTPQQLKARVEQSGVVEVEVFGIDEASLRRVERSRACSRSSSRNRSRSSC
jgi:ABC-type multidrug transport system ATPase subunit